ncbi:hypothetical protein DUI87_25702 [Hirundo rustica rustica]|uniref:Uncharacterized protein n=1 Tax=Hirundo rustica rustica TaxID=333673 RepID=A0A3M0JA78_HIRRU|nr:hypothetical protein DUI87_25702 [Hirundo rustica rustica]
MFEHLLQSNASLQLSLDSYRGQLSVHAPSHKLLNEEFHLIPHEKRSRRPLRALTVFTDASGASHKSVMTWRNPQTQRWEADVEFVEGSPQVAELAAVVRAFEKFSEPINLVTDSAYLVGVVSRAEQAVLKEIDNEHLLRLLSKLIYLISHLEYPFYVMHVRSHTDLPSEIAEGNHQADSLAAPVENACLPDTFQRAKLNHQQYHHNVPGLIRQFPLTRSQARAIVATCPTCQVQAMPSMEKTYLTLNPVMNPVKIVILLLMNSLAAAWIIPQPCQNVWVTLAQTLQKENICLSTASTDNPMSTCLVGIPLQAGVFPAGLDTHRSNKIPEPNTFQPYKGHQQRAVMIVNPLEEWLPSLAKPLPGSLKHNGQRPTSLDMLHTLSWDAGPVWAADESVQFNIIFTGEGFIVTNFKVSYVCKATVKATSLEIQDLNLKIKELLNDTYEEGPFSLFVKPEDVAVKSIALVDCPEIFSLMRYKGKYSWPVRSRASKTEVSCRKNPLQSAQRSCEITIELEQVFWKKPNMTKCKLPEKLPNNILDLQDIKLTEENAQDVAQHILYLLPDATLHVKEVEIIASKISDIVEFAVVSVTLAETVLSILDYILLQEIEDKNFKKITNSILKMTEEVGYKVTYTERNMSVITTSLALLVLRPNPSLFGGLAFGITSYNRGVDLKISVQENPFKKALASVFLPKSLKSFLGIKYSDPDKHSKIQFKFFGTTSLFLDDSLTMERLNTYVVSASIENASIQNLNEPVTVTLHHIDQNRVGRIHFIRDGDLTRTEIDVTHDHVLTLISYAGCGASSLFLGITLMTYLTLENVRRDNPSKILLNLCAALLMLNIVFLTNSWLTSFNQPGLCITVAMLLHYFLLAAFTWMCLESVHFYLALVKVFNVYVPKYILKFCIAGWGIPATVITLVLIINKDFYGNGSLSESHPYSNLLEWVRCNCWIYTKVSKSQIIIPGFVESTF